MNVKQGGKVAKVAKRLKYASVCDDFNEPFEIPLMYFVTRG